MTTRKLAIFAAVFLMFLQFLYLYSQQSPYFFGFNNNINNNKYKNQLIQCPINSEVQKTIVKLILKDGIFWNQIDMDKNLQELNVVEFGVWQGEQLQKILYNKNGINYNSLFYKGVQDSWCPHNQGDVLFDDFEQGKYEAADFVVSSNTLPFVPDINRYLDQLLSLTKINGSAIIIDDPYFFGPRGHRLYGQFLNMLIQNFKCDFKNLNFEDGRGVIPEYSHLKNPQQFKKILDEKFQDCHGMGEFVTHFIAQQEKQRFPIEQLSGIIHNKFQVNIQVIKKYYGKKITNDTSLGWQQGFEKEIQKRWSYAAYFGDAIILVIKKKEYYQH